jgi:hypothetical protein
LCAQQIFIFVEYHNRSSRNGWSQNLLIFNYDFLFSPLLCVVFLLIESNNFYYCVTVCFSFFLLWSNSTIFYIILFFLLLKLYQIIILINTFFFAFFICRLKELMFHCVFFFVSFCNFANAKKFSFQQFFFYYIHIGTFTY